MGPTKNIFLQVLMSGFIEINTYTISENNGLSNIYKNSG